VASRFTPKHLENIFRHKVFKMLLSKGKITKDLVQVLMSLPPARRGEPTPRRAAFPPDRRSGFNLYIEARESNLVMRRLWKAWQAILHAAQAPALRVRVSFSQEKMTYTEKNPRLSANQRTALDKMAY
jgi:hypothetical protein